MASVAKKHTSDPQSDGDLVSRIIDGDDYAFEELVAEIGSILLGHQFNIEKTVRDNHSKYLNSWIKALKDDYTLIATAFAQAQKAVDYFVSSK